jgi:hypothetical protein
MTRRLAPAAALLLIAAPALANPRPLPFSYPYETLPAQGLEIEQVVDTTPVRAFDASGGETWLPLSTLVTEIEYGITSRLELGLYFQLADDRSNPTGAPLRFDGIKQRLRYRFADPGALPVDLAAYLEVAELKSELEIEAKLIAQRRLGRLALTTNLWVERELYYSGRQEWVLHPTLGASYQVSPAFYLGVESWLVAELSDDRASLDAVGRFNSGPLAWLGPAVSLQSSRFWVTLGLYTRLNELDRPARVGDLYGRFWVRMMLGIEL